MALSVLKLAFLTSLAHRVDGHGYLTRPTSRRLNEKKSSYTGITAFGAGQHITNCGKDGLSTPSSQDVVTDVQRGSIMKFDIVIDAHHAGHLEMRLCPFIVNGDDQDISSCTLLQRASAAEVGVSDCTTSDDRDICASIDPNNPGWWYLAPKGPQGNVHSMWFHIPSNVNCPNDRCTVQFTWKTANSCNPHPAAYCNYYRNVVGPQNTWCNNWYCGGFCNSNSNSADNCEATMGNRLCCSEVFTNCAEVKLIGEGGPATSPSPTTVAPTSATPTTASPTTTTPTPSQVEPEPEPEPEQEAEPEPLPENSPCTGEPCADATHCRSKWGYCGSSSAYCNTESTWTPTGCSSPVAQGSCTGEPCSDASHCRSKWDHCGPSSAYCNAESTWTANGCSSLLAHRHEVVEARAVQRHRHFRGPSLIQASSKPMFNKSLPVDEL